MSASTTLRHPRLLALPSQDELISALNATCASIGIVEPADPAWAGLLPLVHELADALAGQPSGEDWPASPILACRRLAMATRRAARAALPGDVDRELVLAISDRIVLNAPAAGPAHAGG